MTYNHIQPVSKAKYDEIMDGIIETANKIEADRGGKRLTGDEGLEIAQQALADNVGLKEYIIKASGATHVDKWLSAQF